MNLLTGSEKSIVTEIPGTTRDLVEETVLFAGNTLRLTDTAGIRETVDAIEKIGVSRAQARLNSAELVFAVFDASKPLDQEDKALLESLRNKHVIAVMNKSDLERKVDGEYFRDNNIYSTPFFIKADTTKPALTVAFSFPFSRKDFSSANFLRSSGLLPVFACMLSRYA